jgi:tetratricopeptide (TPR) repeat protein/tRNA A-37 threonylcarbamoyl transferase component Bud32
MLDANLIDELAEEFACRWRAGERPSVEEYARRYPEHAEEIRDVLPAVVMMEQLKPRREDDTPVDASAGDPDRPPERIGEYRIIRQIGRGGMGLVYEAEQEALGRRVAIKVLPGHLLANEKLRARFRREAQAAARLHHTNIVPVFGVGEHNGRCFYVMQLIAGRGLDQLIRETAVRGERKGESTGRPSECSSLTPVPCPLSPEKVAKIGVQVADALSYAHSQGILHRDIKPSNLLLDQRGAVWMTDFGVAKLVEEANLTQSGDLVGTLKYMPPERFAGQSDARGDVYSLGITLYELLTLQPAFPDTTPQHLIRLVTQEAPPPPRKANPAIPTDLETIILKATARDPAHRYQTAEELGEDLWRFREDRPILARRIGAAGLLWRWCRRNRAVARLLVAVFALLVTTATAAGIAYFRTAAANRQTEEANERMQAALAIEQEQREQAEKMSASALEAMNRIYDRFAPSRIVVTPGLPAGSAEGDGANLPPQPVLSPEAVPLLQDLLGFYERLAREGGDYPTLQGQAAEANQRIGDIRQRLGQLEPALAAYRKAVELYERLNATAADEAVRIRLARTHNEMGRTLRTLQRPDEAHQAHAKALKTLAGASREPASRPEYRYELARSYYFQSLPDTVAKPLGPGRDGPRGPDGFGPGKPHGPDELGRGPPPGRGRGSPGRPPGPDRDGPPPRPGEGARLWQKAIELLEELVNEYRLVPEYRHLLACCYRDAPPERPPFVPGGRGGGDRPPGTNTDTAIRLLRQLVKDFPKVPDFRHDLCETLTRASFHGGARAPESPAGARKLLDEAVELATALAAEYPKVPQYTASQALAHERLGLVLHQLRQTESAEKELRKAVSLQATLARQHPEIVAHDFSLALMESSLSRLLRDVGNYKEARSFLEAALSRLAALPAKDHRLGFVRMHLGQGYCELAEVLTRLGEAEAAAEAQKKAEGYAPPDRGPKEFGPRDRRHDRR